MSPIVPEFLSTSGDMQADRRFEFASGLAEDGDFAGAIDLLEQTIELVPNWPVLPFTLGKYYKAAGDNDKAITHFNRSIELDPEDRQGAALELERLGINAIEGNMPPAFVETLFDQYADRFDEHLVEVLEYNVPALIKDAVDGLYKYRRDLRILDLGCGTGLAGEHLRDYAAHLEGIDLSGGMLDKAAEKYVYDALVQAELVEHLNTSKEVFDLIVAADVLSYFGALEQALSATKSCLKPRGHFIFSVQALANPPPDPTQPDFFLGRARRFSHSKDYLERTIAASGIALTTLTPTVLRKDEGNDVNGYVVVCAA